MMRNEAYQLAEDDLEHSDVTDTDDINVDVKRDTRSSGPWANTSTDAYSRTVHHSSPTSSVPRSRFYMFLVVCALAFIIGIVLGIVIGRYAIKQEEPPSTYSARGADANTGDTAATTTTPEDVTTSTQQTSTSCTCPTPTTDAATVTEPTCVVCPRRVADTSTGDEYKTSLYATLTIAEIDIITTVMNARGFASPSSRFGNNYITHMLLHPTNKSIALGYLDNSDPFSGRYAKVIVVRGKSTPPNVMEYLLGPLNETGDSIVVKQLLDDNGIDFNRRPYDAYEQSSIYALIQPHVAAIKNLLIESFDGTFLGNRIGYSSQTLPTLNNTDRTSSFYLYLQMIGYPTLRILPISGIVHHAGVDTDNWYMSDIYYLKQGPFTSGDELMSAYNSGSLRKFKLPTGYVVNNNIELNLGLNPSLPLRENSEIPPPRTYEPEGPRYTIKGNVVKWMGWSFEWTADPIRGPAIFNVKFNGERVAYEISLQDVTLVYASGTTGAGIAPAVLSDTEYYLGYFNTPRLGVDCPERAAYIHTTMYRGRAISSASACVFEADGQRPLWRHKSGGLVDHHLVVRAPMDLGNYDYSLEFKFYLGGVIETSLAASGFLYASFWDPEDPLVGSEKSNSMFGFRISDFLSGPIHDHSFMFKVDVDVKGTSNSFERIHWRGGDIMDALRTQTNVQEKPGFFHFNNTRYLEYQFQEHEDGFNVDTKKPEIWTIVNENEKNAWGVRRGYRILPITFVAETMPEFIMFGAWPHLKYHCIMTKRKDEEFYGTDSLYDIHHPGDKAFGGVRKMMDNESIRNEDLVAWVTAKFNHAPSAEDLPMTQSVHRGFVLSPFNYFDRTPVFDVQAHYKPNTRPYNPEPCYDPKL